jgi:hypothetical protein
MVPDLSTLDVLVLNLKYIYVPGLYAGKEEREAAGNHRVRRE